MLALKNYPLFFYGCIFICPIYNGQMLFTNKDTNKNLSNPEGKLSASYGAGTNNLSFTSYPKTQKLITALYMVTDIMDKEEPIRNKLRTTGLEIISDPEGKSQTSGAGMSITRIEQVISFLDIAFAMSFISEMNCVILKKEFLELKRSIQELDKKPTWLAEFFENSPLEGYSDHSPHPNPLLKKERGRENSKGHHSIGHQTRTRIGVQKGSTLLKALSEIEMSDRMPASYQVRSFSLELKKQRRDDIITVIKNNQGSANITDIKNKAIGALVSCSEKTLQRELMSMTKDGVLNKTGEKRWSRYSLK